jgi:TonB family protein
LPRDRGGNIMADMKKLLCFLSFGLLVSGLMAPAHTQVTAPAVLPQSSDLTLGVDLLSDTHGADLGPYMRILIADLKKRWLPPATESANRPTPKQEETLIRFTIAPDGHISAMRLESPEQETALDKAAWKAATTITPLPLPAAMKDSSLTVLVHFMK